MIVRRASAAVHLITQPDHAALARRIMEHWRELDARPRRESILLAVGEHDNGWREPDAAPSIDTATGRVHDFINAPASVRQGVWPRAVDRLAHDPWAAALVAQHALTVYDRYRSDPPWNDFFRTMAAMRDALLAGLNQPLQELERDYAFVRIGDLISLIFCTQWQTETYQHWTFRLHNERVTVTPDPFAGATVSFDIAAAEVPDRPFASTGELHQIILTAERVLLRGTVSGAIIQIRRHPPDP